MKTLRRAMSALERGLTLLLRVAWGAPAGSFGSEKAATVAGALVTLLTRGARRVAGRGGVLSSDHVEAKYDALAGSYIAAEQSQERRWLVIGDVPTITTSAEAQQAKASFYADLLRPFAPRSVLEVGAGELTTLARVAEHLPQGIRYLACDLSAPRIDVGRDHFIATTALDVDAIRANAVDLPYSDLSVDVVFTSHALEHMPLDYRAALREMCRVARQAVVLFEPCYETAGWIQKLRMRAQGYVRGLPEAIASAAEFRVIESGLVPHGSPFNRTSFLVLARDHGNT